LSFFKDFFFPIIPSLNQFLARPTYQSAVLLSRVNLLSINICRTPYASQIFVSFTPSLPSLVVLQNITSEYRWIFYILYAYRNEAAGATGIIRGLRDAAEYFNMFVYLTSSLYRKYCTALPLEISAPSRKRAVSWIRGCVPSAPSYPMLSSFSELWQRAANGTLNASTARDVALWTCWTLVTCQCDLYLRSDRTINIWPGIQIVGDVIFNIFFL